MRVAYPPTCLARTCTRQAWHFKEDGKRSLSFAFDMTPSVQLRAPRLLGMGKAHVAKRYACEGYPIGQKAAPAQSLLFRGAKRGNGPQVPSRAHGRRHGEGHIHALKSGCSLALSTSVPLSTGCPRRGTREGLLVGFSRLKRSVPRPVQPAGPKPGPQGHAHGF